MWAKLHGAFPQRPRCDMPAVSTDISGNKGQRSSANKQGVLAVLGRWRSTLPGRAAHLGPGKQGAHQQTEEETRAGGGGSTCGVQARQPGLRTSVGLPWWSRG